MESNKTSKKKKQSASQMVVYFDADKKCKQIVKPKMEGINRFEGNWTALAKAIAGNKGYHSYEIM